MLQRYRLGNRVQDVDQCCVAEIRNNIICQPCVELKTPLKVLNLNDRHERHLQADAVCRGTEKTEQNSPDRAENAEMA